MQNKTYWGYYLFSSLFKHNHNIYSIPLWKWRKKETKPSSFSSTPTLSQNRIKSLWEQLLKQLQLKKKKKYLLNKIFLSFISLLVIPHIISLSSNWYSKQLILFINII